MSTNDDTFRTLLCSHFRQEGSTVARAPVVVEVDHDAMYPHLHDKRVQKKQWCVRYDKRVKKQWCVTYDERVQKNSGVFQ